MTKPGTTTKPTIEPGKLVVAFSVSLTHSDVKKLKDLQVYFGAQNRSETIRKMISALTDEID